MNLQHSRPTVIQYLSVRPLAAVTLLLITLHCLLLALALLLAPTALYVAGATSLPASRCSSDDGGDTACVPLQELRAPLRGSKFRFVFPGDELPPMSKWNWRLLGSVTIDLTFYGPTPEAGVAASSQNESTGDDLQLRPVFGITQKRLTVLLKTRLEKKVGQDEWSEVATAFAERDLACTLSKPLEELILAGAMERTAQYICDLSPFFDLRPSWTSSDEPLTYAASMELLPRLPSEVVAKPADASGHADQSQEVAPESAEYFAFFESEAHVRATLTLIVEDPDFHWFNCWMKVAFIPVVLVCLGLFVARLYRNDLYIAIPDRALAACAAAQLVQDLPLELLSVYVPSSYLSLWEEAARSALLAALALFWAVSAHDRLASNEDWERNTRYYWKQVVLIVLGCLLYLLYATYELSPAVANPLHTRWTSDTAASAVGAIFTLVLASLAFVFQTYLSVLVFRLCFCSSPLQYYYDTKKRRRRRRLDVAMLVYGYLVSAVTVVALLLRLSAWAATTGWASEQTAATDPPLPSYLAATGTVEIIVQGMWNLHICFLLLMLSRVSSSPFTESSPNVRALRFEQQQQQEELGEDPPLYVEDDQEGSLEEHHYFQREIPDGLTEEMIQLWEVRQSHNGKNPQELGFVTEGVLHNSPATMAMKGSDAYFIKEEEEDDECDGEPVDSYDDLAEDEEDERVRILEGSDPTYYYYYPSEEGCGDEGDDGSARTPVLSSIDSREYYYNRTHSR